MSADAPARPALGPIAGATVACDDPDACARIYERHLGYRRAAEGTVDAALAALWAAPRQEGARFVALRPASGAPQWIRFVASPRNGYAPLRTLGWNALEIVVEDVDALRAQLDGTPFTWLSGPHNLANGTSSIRAMQVSGPAGEVLYLTQVPDEPDKAYLPKAQVAVDRLFIAVLGVADAPAAQDWYAERFSVERRPHRMARIRCINKAWGFDEERQHPIASVRLARQGVLEIDGYPEGTSARETVGGHLPPAIAAIAIEVDSLSLVAGTEAAVTSLADPLYGDAPVALLRGPAGERIELVQRGSDGASQLT